MTADDVQYLAAAIKFTAVPIGAIEFMTPASRQRLEQWLVTRLPKLLKAFAIALGLTYVMVMLLVIAGPYVAIAYFTFGGLILGQLQALDGQVQYPSLSVLVTPVIVIAASLEKWVLPLSWVLAIGAPYEHFSTWANGFPGVDWILPDYSGPVFLKHYQDTFNSIEDWLWDWLAFVNVSYFFFSRGLMLLVIIFIQLSLFAGLTLAATLCLLLPIEIVILASDRLKNGLHIVEGQIPIAAFMLLLIGETLDFGTKTFCRWAGTICS
jgi:hypothetical protein